MSRTLQADKLVQHPAFKKGFEEVKTNVLSSPPGSIHRVFGLTGAGKTEIALALARTIAGHPSSWPTGSLPVAIARATKSEAGRFSTKYFATCMHAAVNEPDLRWAYRKEEEAGLEPELQEHSQSLQRTKFWCDLRSNSNESKLRDGCLTSWKERRVRVVLVDDANAIASVKGRASPSDYLQPWVAAAEESRTTLVFFGTSIMKSLWDGEGEINRRAQTVYVGRYRLESEAERKLFISMLVNLTSAPAWKDLNIRKMAEEIYYYTFGVFGQAKKLVNDTVDAAKACGRDRVTKDDLRYVLPNADDLRLMAERVAVYDLLSDSASLETAKKIYSNALLRGKTKSAAKDRA